MKSTKTDADVVVEFESSPERVRQIMESVGSKIGNVHFIKRSNGQLRKMSYRLHVSNPKVGAKPKGVRDTKGKDRSNNLITVYSTNDVVRDGEGNIIGRGAYKAVPLENVVRVVAGGKVYEIQKND